MEEINKKNIIEILSMSLQSKAVVDVLDENFGASSIELSKNDYWTAMENSSETLLEISERFNKKYKELELNINELRFNIDELKNIITIYDSFADCVRKIKNTYTALYVSEVVSQNTNKENENIFFILITATQTQIELLQEQCKQLNNWKHQKEYNKSFRIAIIALVISIFLSLLSIIVTIAYGEECKPFSKLRDIIKYYCCPKETIVLHNSQEYKEGNFDEKTHYLFGSSNLIIM